MALTEEYMDTWPGRGGCGPLYIPWLRVTEEYIALYSLLTRNRGIYFYIPRYR
jgi:hypothetical protein